MFTGYVYGSANKGSFDKKEERIEQRASGVFVWKFTPKEGRWNNNFLGKESRTVFNKERKQEGKKKEKEFATKTFILSTFQNTFLQSRVSM